MKNRSVYVKNANLLMAIWAMVIAFIITANPASAQAPAKVKNIVLVHGAFADASGWEEVYKILKSRGYHVTAVQNPLSSLEDDVDATTRIID